MTKQRQLVQTVFFNKTKCKNDAKFTPHLSFYLADKIAWKNVQGGLKWFIKKGVK